MFQKLRSHICISSSSLYRMRRSDCHTEGHQSEMSKDNSENESGWVIPKPGQLAYRFSAYFDFMESCVHNKKVEERFEDESPSHVVKSLSKHGVLHKQQRESIHL